MGTRSALIALLLIAFLAGAWFTWQWSDAPEQPTPAAESPVAAPAPLEALTTPLEAPAVPRQPAEALAASVPAPKTPDLGTIVVLDEQGQDHATESGSFDVWIVGTHPTTIEVTAGTWSAPLPEGTSFSVTRI